MNRDMTFNFSAGPSMLPTEVLQQAAGELLNYKESGQSVMEMSHRSREFMDIFSNTKAALKETLSVPDSHEILFLQGGASLQFSAIPLNLTAEGDSVDYAVTGNFSKLAAKEAKRYCTVNLAANTEEGGFVRVPRQEELKLSADAKYFYYCSNNTKPVDVSKYGLVYAGAQKNMAPAGLTVVILDKALAGKQRPYTPQMLGYDLMIEKDSMYNTPPTYNIYMLGLVLEWLKSKGGVAGMEQLKKSKAAILYNYLDESKLFHGCADKDSRSDMNVTFRTGDADLDAAFIKEAAANGLLNLKGHRVAGGMRASIYNAMPVEGVEKLVEIMKKFEVEHHV